VALAAVFLSAETLSHLVNLSAMLANPPLGTGSHPFATVGTLYQTSDGKK